MSSVHNGCLSLHVFRIKGLTPLSCAAWSGKVDIIDYLLNIEGVTAKDGGFSEPMVHHGLVHTHCFGLINLYILNTLNLCTSTM